MSADTPEVKTPQISRNSALIGAKLSERFFDQEALAQALGIQEEKDEEFWTVQRYIVVDRVYSYLAHQIGLDLAINRDTEIDDLDTARVLYQATKYKGVEFYMNNIRPWYLNYGKMQVEAAKERRRIREYLQTHGLYILAFSKEEGKRPLFVKIDPFNGQASLVENREEATMIEVGNVAYLEKNSKYLTEVAEQFSYLKATLDAKELKIFVGSKHPQ